MLRMRRYGLYHEETAKGKFGVLKTRTHKSKEYFVDDKNKREAAIFKNIERFSDNGVLLFDFYIAFNLEKDKENFCLLLNTRFKGDSTIMLDLHRDKKNHYIDMSYRQDGVSECISPETYSRIKNIIFGACNPNFDYISYFFGYEIEVFFDILRECNKSQINDFLIYCDKEIIKNKNKIRTKINTLEKIIY